VACHAGPVVRAARLELADVLRGHAPPLVSLTPDRARVVRALIACRTAELGGHLQRCEQCGRERPRYNSCRNRHCPKCQSLRAGLWVEARRAECLPVHYFHVVFTLPESLRPLFLAAPCCAQGLLFAAGAETLLDVCRTRLGATPGFSVVLHTWTQTLLYHPHLHCIVTGGGLNRNRDAWIRSRPSFFLPVRLLSQVFRGKLLEKLSRACQAEPSRIPLPASRALLRQAARRAWVVYCKPPLAGPEQVLRYLGRYTHRIAIGTERLLALRDGQVSFRYKDRRKNRRRVMRLPAEEFSRRFLLHALPRGLVRVRHYGLLANADKTRRLALCRSLLGAPQPPRPTREPRPSWSETYRRLVGQDPLLCPFCRVGRLVVVAEIPRSLAPPDRRNAPPWRPP